MGVVTNLLSGVYKKAANSVSNQYKCIGLNWFEARILKNQPLKTEYSCRFLNKRISYRSQIEFLHSVDEIYRKEIYKSDIDPATQPYILDCGANIGLSVIYFRKTLPNSTVIAFEPDEVNFALLTSNVNAQELSNVQCRKEAVWVHNNGVQFEAENSMSSHISLEAGAAGKKNRQVPSIRLRDELDRPVDLLKMDIEGAEYEVLKDIEVHLPLVKRIFIEYHGQFSENHKLEEMLSLLTSNQFNYYITEANTVYKTPFYRDFKNASYDQQLNIFCFKN